MNVVAQVAADGLTPADYLSIWLAVVGLAGTLLGVFLGWYLAFVGERRKRRMRHLDEFAAVIIEELGAATNLPDNEDLIPVQFHDASKRRLDGWALYISTKHEDQWKKISNAWDDYEQLVSARLPNMGVSTEGPVERKLLLAKLNSLLEVVLAA